MIASYIIIQRISCSGDRKDPGDRYGWKMVVKGYALPVLNINDMTWLTSLQSDLVYLGGMCASALIVGAPMDEQEIKLAKVSAVW